MPRIVVDLQTQTLTLYDDDDKVARRYPVSTAKNGAGERNGSFCTPRGRHVIRARIGYGQPVNTVFVKRRPTGEIYTHELGERYPRRDWILTRILWLSGLERGFNRLGDVDTMRRYIYIHGTPDDVSLSEPGSIGCIRMKNSDLLELFDRVTAGTTVLIAGNASQQHANPASVL
ncbi:MAG: L,D-transpeptidase family protein [Burkholderiales bacterium]|nr:L,D-transpeptidase [Burkholderiales bacterium]MDQ3195093.1 L,D-transpeptidase [Pseudomonadota bacterium]